MVTRYCRECRAEVEEVEGYCLLGHKVSLEAPSSSITELRAEVDRVFEEVDRVFEDARMSVATALAPPPPPPPSFVSGGATATGGVSPTEPSSPRPPTSPVQPPPQSSPRVFDELESARPMKNDPISAFAPPPRMDWGPEGSVLRRRPRRRGVTSGFSLQGVD